MGPAGPGSGAGLCVFTSIEHDARWQNEPRLWKFQEQMTHEPGGGYPSKVDDMIKKYAPGVSYLQYEGHDPAFLKQAMLTHRMVAVTYNGHDCHYGNQHIAHMVNLIHLSDAWACILDNNYPTELVWMTPSAFYKRWTGSDSNGWAVVLLNGPPPPSPWTEIQAQLKRIKDNLTPNIDDEEVQGGRVIDQPDRDYGVDPSKISQTERCSWNGALVTRTRAWELIGTKEIPNDQNLLRLSIISRTESIRSRVVSDLQTDQALGAYRTQFVTQSYSPDNWAVLPFGSKSEVEIVIQRPDGQVLFHQLDYQDGPTGLAKTLAAALKIYDPSKVPDARAAFDLTPYIEWAKAHMWWVLGAGGVIITLLWLPKLSAGRTQTKAIIPVAVPVSPPVSQFESLISTLITSIEQQKAADARRASLMQRLAESTSPQTKG
jgi:hypothetical protein